MCAGRKLSCDIERDDIVNVLHKLVDRHLRFAESVEGFACYDKLIKLVNLIVVVLS